ncbi:MAG: DUF1330 domain-containing protein [Lachnospiraceae bacterium]|nr:DUF1330 domain-containing protein [Lachnospiraceae bacterium]
MNCYFCVDVYFDEKKKIQDYMEYIKQVRPIVEAYGGIYLTRSEKIISLSGQRKPDRVIIIRFQTREQLDNCFSSNEYNCIKQKRENNVDARAIIVEED